MEEGAYVGAILPSKEDSGTWREWHAAPFHHICPRVSLTNEEIQLFTPLQDALVIHVRRPILWHSLNLLLVFSEAPRH